LSVRGDADDARHAGDEPHASASAAQALRWKCAE
jgi:hypothetical protein